jgi:hypothetical protein
VTPEARAARERKQKIFVAVGGVVLLLLLGLQLPGYLGGSSSTASSTTSTELTTGADPAPTPVPAPGGNTPAAVATAAEPAKLSSFSSFSRKDPFVQQVESDPGTSTSAPAPAGSSGGKKKEDEKTSGQTTKFSVGGKATSAVTIVSVNGQRQALSPGSAFPASDPVFVLVAEKPGSKAVVIGVKGGAYASGASTTKLVVGKPLTLVNTTTGARYKIVLVAVGSGGEPTPKSAGPSSP